MTQFSCTPVHKYGLVRPFKTVLGKAATMYIFTNTETLREICAVVSNYQNNVSDGSFLLGHCFLASIMN